MNVSAQGNSTRSEVLSGFLFGLIIHANGFAITLFLFAKLFLTPTALLLLMIGLSPAAYSAPTYSLIRNAKMSPMFLKGFKFTSWILFLLNLAFFGLMACIQFLMDLWA